jgi:hypothetical protein
MWDIYDSAVRDVLTIMADGWVEEHTLHSLYAFQIELSGFLPVGTPKTIVNAAVIDNEKALHHRTVVACQTICSYPGIFQRIRRSMKKRVEALLNLMEDILSTYYKRILSAVNHKLNVSGHLLTWSYFLVLICGTRAQNLSGPVSYNLYNFIH